MPGEGSQKPFQSPQWHIATLCEFRVVVIRPIGARGRLFFTDLPTFSPNCRTVTPISGLSSTGIGERVADFKGTFTVNLIEVLRMGFPVRLFGGKPDNTESEAKISGRRI